MATPGDDLSSRESRMRRRAAEIVLVASIGAIVVVQFLSWTLSAQLMLAVTLALSLVGLAALGVAINGRLLGVVIDNRNMVSLSKLQMLIWTMVVLSAMAVITSRLIYAGYEHPLQQYVPWELLAAMGISAATLVGAPAVLSRKLDDQPSVTGVGRSTDRDPTLTHVGGVATRENPSEARFSDIFTGDDITNATAPDISKIQNFAITLMLVGTYLSALFTQLAKVNVFAPARIQSILDAQAKVAAAAASAAPTSAEALQPLAEVKHLAEAVLFFPPLSHEFLWLMGISHGAYLAYKAAPHGRTTSAAAAAEKAGGLPVAQMDALG
jgi:hypothetical protein